MTIRLLDVNESNWRECADLQLAEEEKIFLSSNVYTIAEWKFETESVFRAIYSDTVLVGMLAYYLES
jgi:diamine N-acetyltransferase